MKSGHDGPCNCPCHDHPGTLHIMPCCNHTYVQRIFYARPSVGTTVKTTRANPAVIDWTPDALVSRQWEILGEITAHHDAHGLSFEVKHPDGTIGHYDRSEFDLA